MITIRELAKDATMDAAETMCKDASFIPSEMLDWSPMDYGKSVNAILSECARLNMTLVAVLRGETPVEGEAGVDFEALKGCVVASARHICDTIDAMSDEALEDEVQMPWGAMMSSVEAIMLAASHMNYHDGQINYIQLLLGDTKFHWAED